MSTKMPVSDVEKYKKRIYDCVIPSVLLHRSLSLVEVEQAWFSDHEPMFLSEALVKAGFSDLLEFVRQYPDDVRILSNSYCGTYFTPGPRPPKLIEGNVQLIRGTQSFKKPNPYNQEKGILSRKYQWRYRAAAERAKLEMGQSHSADPLISSASGATTLSAQPAQKAQPARPVPILASSVSIGATRAVATPAQPPHGHHISYGNPPSVSGSRNVGLSQIPCATSYRSVPVPVLAPYIPKPTGQFQASWANRSDLDRPAYLAYPSTGVTPETFSQNLPLWYTEKSSSVTGDLMSTPAIAFVPRSVRVLPMSNEEFLSIDRKTNIAMEKYSAQSVQFRNGSAALPMKRAFDTPISVMKSAVRASSAIAGVVSSRNEDRTSLLTHSAEKSTSECMATEVDGGNRYCLSVKSKTGEPSRSGNGYTQTIGFGLSEKYLARIRFYQERREQAAALFV